MATKTFTCTKDASVLATGEWSGYDDHHPIGRWANSTYVSRAFLYFPISFTGMSNIVSAKLYFYEHRDAPYHAFFDGSDAIIFAYPMGADWGEGDDRGENYWSNMESWDWNNRANAYKNPPYAELGFTSSLPDGTLREMDVFSIVDPWFRGIRPNYGFILRNADEITSGEGVEMYSRHVPGKAPFLVIEYTTNTPPTAPTGLQPTGNAVVSSLTPGFTGTRADSDAGDYITAFDIEVYEDDGVTLKWNSGTILTTGKPTTFSANYAGPALIGNKFYKWRARTRDSGAEWSPASAFARFKANSTPRQPILSISESPIEDLMTLTPTLNVAHVDADPGDEKMHGYRIVLEKSDGAPVWDSGDISTASAPIATHTFVYSGPPLAWGQSYRWRARTRDSNLIWGAYSTNQVFTLHKTGTPTSLDPTASEIIGGRRPTFTASKSDAIDKIQSYRIYVYAQDGTTVVHDTGILTSGIADQASISYTLPFDLSYNTQYKWKIAFNLNTSDFGGPSDYTTVESFFTIQDASSATQTAPVGSGITSLTPTFTGTRSTPFTFFQILLFGADGVTQIHDTGVIAVASTTSYSYVYNGPALSWGKTYRWRVSVGGGSYSGLQLFTTNAAGAPILIAPIKNAWIKSTAEAQLFQVTKGIPGIVALYRLNDTDVLARDSVGTNHGAFFGGYTQNQSGPGITTDKTTNFGGTGSVGASHHSVLDFGNEFTISFWFYREGVLSGAQTMFYKGVNAPQIYFGSDNKVHVAKGGGGDAAVDPEVINGTGWHNVTYVRSASLGINKLYVDGIYDPAGTATTQTFANTTNVMEFPPPSFTGRMSNVAIFNRPLNDHEAREISDAAYSTDLFFGRTTDQSTLTHVNTQLYDDTGKIVIDDSGWLDVTDRSTFSVPYSGLALQGGRDYRWSARIRSASGPESLFAPQGAFHLNAAPSIPTNVFPTPGYIFNNTLAPTFKATFADADKYLGDYPTSWVIEIRNADTDALIQTKTITLGLNSGENVYVWMTDGTDTALAYGIDYKWSTYFVDSKGAIGSRTGWSVFRLGRPPISYLTSPSGSLSNPSTVATIRPVITWNYSDPAGYPQSRFILIITKTYNGRVAYTLDSISTARSVTIPNGYLAHTDIYQVSLYVMNSQGLISEVPSVAYMEVRLDAPHPITVFNTYIDEEQSKIVLRWENPPLKPGHMFLYTAVYRRPVGESEWTMIATSRQSRTSATDWYAGQGISYEYKVTQFTTTPDGSDLESPDSPEITARLESDVWMVVGKDRASGHVFELPVSDEQHTRPVQQEVFEPVGSNRKIVARGAVLGHEGTVTAVWMSEETVLAREQIEYLLTTPGPHILKNPFGDVFDVEFAGPDYQFIGGGNLTVTLTYIEIGRTSDQIETY